MRVKKRRVVLYVICMCCVLIFFFAKKWCVRLNSYPSPPNPHDDIDHFLSSTSTRLPITNGGTGVAVATPCANRS